MDTKRTFHTRNTDGTVVEVSIEDVIKLTIAELKAEGRAGDVLTGLGWQPRADMLADSRARAGDVKISSQATDHDAWFMCWNNKTRPLSDLPLEYRAIAIKIGYPNGLPGNGDIKPVGCNNTWRRFINLSLT